jgi:hypothetical protein
MNTREVTQSQIMGFEPRAFLVRSRICSLSLTTFVDIRTYCEGVCTSLWY